MKMRLLVAGLTLSAGGLISLALSENYVPEAAPPVRGDVPTAGFGSTTNERGEPLKAGEKVDPVRALVLLRKDAGGTERALQQCLAGVALFQHEWDAYMELGFNVGAGAVCGSSIPAKLRAGEYEAACRTVLDFDGFRDCSKPKVWDAKRGRMVCPLVRLRGLTLRREREAAKCLGVE